MYTQIYKGQLITTTRVTDDYGKTHWYSTINGGDANDWLRTKKDAIAGAKEMIDSPAEYDLILI